MKFMLMMNAPQGTGDWNVMTWPPQDLKAHIDFMIRLNQELTASKELVGAEGLDIPANARIVRATGGLVDTVEPYDAASGQGTGFRFSHPDGTGLVWALDQALEAHGDAQAWTRLMRAGMARDFSWERTGRETAAVYQEVYDEVRRRP